MRKNRWKSKNLHIFYTNRVQNNFFPLFPRKIEFSAKIPSKSLKLSLTCIFPIPSLVTILFIMDSQIPCTFEGCSSTFSTPSTLRRHIRIIHQGTRPESCPICEKAFRDKYSLKIHVKTHVESEENAGNTGKCLDGSSEKMQKMRGNEEYVTCFICEMEVESGVVLEHVQEHVKGLIEVCEETAEMMRKCEVSLQHAEVGVKGRE